MKEKLVDKLTRKISEMTPAKVILGFILMAIMVLVSMFIVDVLTG